MKNIFKTISIGLLVAFTLSTCYAQRTEVEKFFFLDEVAVSNDLTVTGELFVKYNDPVFYIPNIGDQGWTDFELKGSTNNFFDSGTYGQTGRTDFFYWYHSPNPEIAIYTHQVYNIRPDVYFTYSGAASPGGGRQWFNQKDYSESIYDIITPINANAIIGGWIVVVRGLNIRQIDIKKWVWSYCLMDADGHDTDASNSLIWRPAFPVGFIGTNEVPNL